MTDAEHVAALAGNNGRNRPTAFTAALGEATAVTHENEGISNAPIRYEFSDGSAIVDAGSGWDFGVHRSRLSEAAARYSPDWNDDEPGDIQFAWVGAGYGLNETDALERRQT